MFLWNIAFYTSYAYLISITFCYFLFFSTLDAFLFFFYSAYFLSRCKNELLGVFLADVELFTRCAYIRMRKPEGMYG